MKAIINEGLEFVCGCFCQSPGFRSIQQDWFHVGTEDVDFGLLMMLSHLVRLPGPNPSSMLPPPSAPTRLCSYYFIWVRTAVHLRQSQQLFTPFLSNGGAGEGGKMHKIALCTFIYLSF